MKWFFGYNGNGPWRYDDHIQALIRSAVANTSLDGHLIYFGLHEEDHPIVAFAESHGVTVVRHTPSILEDLQRINAKFEDYRFEIASGGFFAIDIPLICRDLGYSDEFVLYTDLDAIFLDDVSQQSDQPFFQPRFISVGPQVSKTDWGAINAGVIVMNVVNLLDDFPAFKEFITSGDTLYYELFKKGRYDERAYEVHYDSRWDKLPLEYNWRPYWGFNEDARIVHWHGPKIHLVRRMLNGPRPERLRPVALKLFEQDPDGYRKYLALAEEYTSGWQ